MTCPLLRFPQLLFSWLLPDCRQCGQVCSCVRLGVCVRICECSVRLRVVVAVRDVGDACMCAWHASDRGARPHLGDCGEIQDALQVQFAQAALHWHQRCSASRTHTGSRRPSLQQSASHRVLCLTAPRSPRCSCGAEHLVPALAI